MLRKLMPRSDDFFNDFDAQCAMTVEGTRMLHALLSDYRDVANRVQAIEEIEHRGDEVTHTAVNRLHKEFVTPFDRTQIHSLLSRIDDVLDFTHAAAARLLYYEIEGDLRSDRDGDGQVSGRGRCHRGRGAGAFLRGRSRR